jgi:predicted RNA-binding Zn-ribbon protein involved in translation (DUF1610 family)
VKRRRVVLYPMLCLSCSKRWGASPAAAERPCPFCGSPHTMRMVVEG